MSNNEQMNSLINQLAQRLNASTSDVETALKKGNLDKVLQNMDQKQAQKISQILSDPEQSKKILKVHRLRHLSKN